MNIQQAVAQAIAGKNIEFDEMVSVVRTIMFGDATSAQIAGLLVALNMKGETVDEVTAAASVMRELAVSVSVPDDCAPLIDTAGTGGDSAHTFNISTATAFVVAAAGAYVAKHGNRSVSSSSGSADVLAEAGANIELEPTIVAHSIRETGVGFMFAPAHHRATRYAVGPRRELGIRTLFNVLGPLTNPAGARMQLVGVFDRHWQTIVVEALARLGTERALVVNAKDGLDELSISSITTVAELCDGRITWFEVDPKEFGIEIRDRSSIVASDAEHSLKIIRKVFDNEPGPARDIVALNGGAAIYICGLADTIAGGVERANQVLAEGSARDRFNHFIEFTKRHRRAP